MLGCEKCDYFHGYFHWEEMCRDCMKVIDGLTVMTNWVPLSCLKVIDEERL